MGARHKGRQTGGLNIVRNLNLNLNFNFNVNTLHSQITGGRKQ
jgi:hypothetical protein